MSGSVFQRETWEISQLSQLPDSVLAMREQGEGVEAQERETSRDKYHPRGKLNALRSAVQKSRWVFSDLSSTQPCCEKLGSSGESPRLFCCSISLSI